MKPFRFLADVGGVRDARRLADAARHAESVGYDVVVIPDHLVDQLAPIPVLATVAAATKRLRIGTFVLNNDLRHPAVLAQDLASLDVLSGGRLEIGIGAGWNQREYAAIGMSFDPGSLRVERLAESVAVLKGLFGDGPFSFAGTHYSIVEMDGRPKPAQRPHPPFMIGGGSRRVLELAGREADIVGLAPRPLRGGGVDASSALVSATAEKIAWVRQAAGARFEQLELNVYPSPAFGDVQITDDALAAAREAAGAIRRRWGVEIAPAELLESPHVYIGTVEQLAEKLVALREQFGISSLLLDGAPGIERLVERLAGT